MVTSSQHLPVLDIPRPFEALSDVSNDSSHNGRDCDSQEAAVSERLSQPPSLYSGPSGRLTPSIVTPSPGHKGLDGPQDKTPSSFHCKSKKKSKKHKDKEKAKISKRERENQQENEKKRKSRDEHVPEPNRACEISSSPGSLKSNSIPHKSTGETHARSFLQSLLSWSASDITAQKPHLLNTMSLLLTHQKRHF